MLERRQSRGTEGGGGPKQSGFQVGKMGAEGETLCYISP